MEIKHGDFVISDDPSLINFDIVHELLSKTYWAQNRTKKTMKKSIENSLCFGVYKDGIQVGFARCVTDYAFMFWLGDVIIAEEYRSCGLGKALVGFITGHEKMAGLIGFLGTKDAHGLYEQFGFVMDARAMRKAP
ncbi:MAG: GNAT family N-acetyltransferase [Lachnospiraceae bacterium]|nr:GNAT family N-acetyltransferase [Lachnospiraceae bacterium]